MNIISKDTLTALINQAEGPKVSLYLPTHRAASPEHLREDTLRFKNLLSTVDGILKNRDSTRRIHDAITVQLKALLQDQDFWRHQTEGLAIFVNPVSLTYFNLPLTTDEYVAVDTHYHLAPLLGLLQESQPYYVLAIARQHPILYKGDQYKLERADIELPIDPEAALHIDEITTEDRGKYALRGQRMASTGTVVYGRGGGEKDEQDEFKRQFFRIIDQKICRQSDISLPLIVAGTETEVCDYKDISSHPKLLEETIEGNHTTGDIAYLHQAAQKIILKDIQKKHNALHERYDELTGAERTVTDPAAILDATEKGRIDTLLLALKATTPDNAQDSLAPEPKITFPSENNRALIDQVALQAWSMGGTIYNCEASHLADSTAMAAMLRY